MAAFDWEALEIDGHSFSEIQQAFAVAKKSQRPVMIIANTIKGKGVSFMENGIKWHHSLPSGDELDAARAQLAPKSPAGELLN